ncbi:MAG: PilZ domain-containing protein [Desulfobulbaceae bacterium]|nr:PilZ domain-containing protein [Desulfobulbaceae bacterium]
MSQKNQKEFREFPRLPKEVTVEVSELTYPMPTEPGEIVKSTDISALGIRFISATPFKPGTILTINVHLAGWQRHKKNLSALLDDAALTKPLSVIAEVIWSKKGGKDKGNEIGIKFKDIADDDFQAIKRALCF